MKRITLMVGVLVLSLGSAAFALDPFAAVGKIRPSTQGLEQAIRSVTEPMAGTADRDMFASLGAMGGQAGGGPDGNNIVIYAAQWCGYCRQALAYMNSHQIQYIHKDIERDSVAKAQYAELRRAGKVRGVPMIYVGSETLNGWSASQFDAMVQRLQARAGSAQPRPAEPPGGAGFGGLGAPLTGLGQTAGPDAAPTVSYRAGDVLVARIARVSLLAAALPKARPLGQLGKREELVFLGEAQDGFLKVRSATLVGWVDQSLVGRP